MKLFKDYPNDIFNSPKPNQKGHYAPEQRFNPDRVEWTLIHDGPESECDEAEKAASLHGLGSPEYFWTPEEVFHTISETRNEHYTLMDGLKKFMARSYIKGAISFEPVMTCGYGSKDLYVHFHNLRTSSTVWTSSPDFQLTGKIPAHITNNGRLSIGEFGCGCFYTDDKYGEFVHPKETTPFILLMGCFKPDEVDFEEGDVIEITSVGGVDHLKKEMQALKDLVNEVVTRNHLNPHFGLVEPAIGVEEDRWA